MMVLSPLKVKVENRGAMYYNKYMYRGTFYMWGVRRTSNAKNMLDYLKTLKYYAEHASCKIRAQQELDAIDLNQVEQYLYQ